MAKKAKKSFFSKFGMVILFIIGVLICVCMVFPAVTRTIEGSDPYIRYGYEVAFGKTLIDGGIPGVGGVKNVITFSILAVIAYILPLLVALLMGVLVKNRKISGLVCFLVFTVAAVLFFIMPSITSVKITVEAFGSSAPELKTFADLKYTLGYGSIIAGVLSVIGALVSGAYAIVK